MALANTEHYPRVSPVRLVAEEAPETSGRITAQQRLQQLRKAFQRELRQKPTSVQAQLMDRAALLSVRAEAAIYSNTTSLTDVVRIDRAAENARQQMRESFKPPKRKAPPTLSEVLRS